MTDVLEQPAAAPQDPLPAAEARTITMEEWRAACEIDALPFVVEVPAMPVGVVLEVVR